MRPGDTEATSTSAPTRRESADRYRLSVKAEAERVAVKPPLRTVQRTPIVLPEAAPFGPLTWLTTRSGGGVSVICAALEAPTLRSERYSNTFPASETSCPANSQRRSE